MSKSNIVLTGFMGSGKTTVGKMLAKRLDYEFVDTDELIEIRSGTSIPAIFRDKGEDAFRDMEREIARELAGRSGVVISTGGRMMLDPENARMLSQHGRVFCLVATPEEILERVRRDADHQRPLLDVANPIERIVELLDQRRDGYGRFTQWQTSDKTPEDVTRNLIGAVAANPDIRVSIDAPSERYEFIVGGGLLPYITHLANIGGPVAIITDDHIHALYSQSCGPVDTVVTVAPGSRHKTLATVQTICEQLVDAGIDRNGTVIGLGGSVINGLAGFAAAIYMRGIDCVQCPTSLLAMVDTSIGGKSGINLPQGKNLIGAFKHPRAVIVDVATLQSLSPREFACGMAEVIKHALIADHELLRQIETDGWILRADGSGPSPADLQALVARAIQVKINIVQQDPFDRGRRQVLNLGHTFAHAIEQVSGHRIRHGEAVALGLVAAANLSARLGHCASELQQRIEAVLDATQLPRRLPRQLDPNQLLQVMRHDKKNKAGRMRLVLPRGVGDVFVADDVDPAAITDALRSISE